MSIYDNAKRVISSVPSGVCVLAAAKTRNADEVMQAIFAGIRVIGENYVQEAKEIHKMIKGKAQLHLIGHLQSNKVKDAVEIFDMIQTVDSIKIAREISKRSKGRFPALIEINSGLEESKFGVSFGDAKGLIKEISRLDGILIKGLMTMAPYSEDPENSRPYFKRAKELFEGLKRSKIENVEMEILSMGMSDSFLVAAEEGSTMVRIGSAIFGPRSH